MNKDEAEEGGEEGMNNMKRETLTLETTVKL